jgi:hypothetical protein
MAALGDAISRRDAAAPLRGASFQHGAATLLTPTGARLAVGARARDTGIASSILARGSMAAWHTRTVADGTVIHAVP